jgi:hypothetical protein
MSIHSEADLILRLYELRREATMRQARDWFFLGFNPTSVEDFNAVMFSDKSGYARMVTSYWEMAAALVNHGAIGADLFNDTNSEYISVFSKVEPFLADIRAAQGAGFMKNLEKLIDSVPHGRARTAAVRERVKGILARLEAKQNK